MYIEIDKVGSVTGRLALGKSVRAEPYAKAPRPGDVVVTRALTESITYGHLELSSGRLAKINRGDVLLGVLGKRRALKGFVGDVPGAVFAGDHLHLLNMGGVIGECTGHHSSLTDAIGLEVIGIVVDELGIPMNIADGALEPADELRKGAPIVMVAGSCMNSGKTVAAVEIIRQASNAGMKVAGAKLTGIACLRDTLNMQDHGAVATASFLDCGLPSTVDVTNLPAVAAAIFNDLNRQHPDIIVAELGDGIVGGYGVDTILRDSLIMESVASFIFCASDYVGVIGGMQVLSSLGISIDAVAGSVTDSAMGEDFIKRNLGLATGNARRDAGALFEVVQASISREAVFA